MAKPSWHKHGSTTVMALETDPNWSLEPPMERLQMPPPTAMGPVLFVQSTPIKTGISSTTPFTTNKFFCIKSYMVRGKEMKNFSLGQCLPTSFWTIFFPISGLLPGFDTISHFKNNNYYSTVAARCEIEAYAPFVSRLSWASGHLYDFF